MLGYGPPRLPVLDLVPPALACPKWREIKTQWLGGTALRGGKWWVSDPHVLATRVNENDGYLGVSAKAFDPPEISTLVFIQCAQRMKGKLSRLVLPDRFHGCRIAQNLHCLRQRL